MHVKLDLNNFSFASVEILTPADEPPAGLAHLIAEEMSLGDMMTLLKLRKGEYSVVEEKIHPNSGVINKPLSELKIPAECVIAAIIRKGKLVIPHGDTMLLIADAVLAVVHSTQVKELARALA